MERRNRRRTGKQAAGQAVIEVENLTVTRGAATILSGIQWRVQFGEHWVILGANGSGKTSLLSALTGYLSPSGGEISVLGRRYGQTDWRELRKLVGLVSSSVRQLIEDGETGLDVVVSGRDAVLNLWRSATGTEQKEARRILQLTECEYLAERPWGYLSQGERQRVLIGRALMAKCRVLILDEPCAGLDPVARENFLGFLGRLSAEKAGPSLVLVTHHVEEIVPVFSHVLLLKDGRVLEAGPRRVCLNSENLSEAFGAKVQLSRQENRYVLKVNRNPEVVA